MFWLRSSILQWYHIVHIAAKIGGDITIGRFILIPMILGGDIYQMQRTEAWFQGEHWSQRCRHGSRGSMSNMFLALHQSDIPSSKGERLFRGISRHPGRGSIPKESSHRGSSPKERNTLFH
jgi:hypothetical protein